MPFFTRCPYCRHRVNVPDRAMAESLKCPSCRSWYTVTPDSEPEARSEPARSSGVLRNEARTPVSRGSVGTVAPPPTKPAVTVAPPPPVPAAAAPPPPAAGNEPTPAVLVENMHLGTTPVVPEETESGWSPHPLGLVACTVGGIALIASTRQSMTFLTQPLSGVGFILGLVAILMAAGGKPIRQLFPVVGTIVSAGTLLIALFNPSLLGPRYEVSREASTFDPDEIKQIPLVLTAEGAQNLEMEGWVDATRAAVQQGRVRVQVMGASIGPVQVIDAKKRFTKTSYLAVSVRVQHLGHGGPIRFVHWDEQGVRPVSAPTATCNGVRLSLASLAPDTPLGVKYGFDLHPGRAVDDVLLFDPPSKPGAVRLELPGEAWEGHVAFRFQIPASMIATQQSAKNR